MPNRKKPYGILIIDPVDVRRKMKSKFVRSKKKFHVEETGNHEEGLKMIKEDPWDLIILGRHKGVDIVELACAIHEIKASIPIVLVTSREGEHESGYPFRVVISERDDLVQQLDEVLSKF